MKNYVVISCRMIEKELLKIMEEHHVSWPVIFIPPHLHGDMEKLRNYLQDLIDRISNVEGILLTISRCGNAAVGLKATTADLILPRCDDCLDLLLSEHGLRGRKRPAASIFLTESWLDSMEDSDQNFENLCKRYGEDTAVYLTKMMYRNYESYLLIDTGVYDVAAAAERIRPKAELLDLAIETRPGPCVALKKLVTERFDEDFIIVKQGNSVAETDFYE